MALFKKQQKQDVTQIKSAVNKPEELETDGLDLGTEDHFDSEQLEESQEENLEGEYEEVEQTPIPQPPRSRGRPAMNQRPAQQEQRQPQQRQEQVQRKQQPTQPQEPVQPQVQYVPVPKAVTEAEMLNTLYEDVQLMKQALGEIIERLNR